MVLLVKDMDETMPQTVPSAGFTPPCDYSNFAENFDLSLLPGGDLPLSPSTPLYSQSLPSPKHNHPRIFTSFFPSSPEIDAAENSLELAPDFQKLLDSSSERLSSSADNIFLEIPSNKSFTAGSPRNSLSPYPQNLLSPNGQYNSYRSIDFYPSSPEASLYTSSPNSIYSRSPSEEYQKNPIIKQENQYTSTSTSPLPCFSPYRVKEENFLSPCGFSSPTSPATSYSSLSSPEQISFSQNDADVLGLLENTVLDKQIKQESTVDFTTILKGFEDSDNLKDLFDSNLEKTDNKDIKPKDHQLLREVLRDTSFQKKFNIRPVDFDFGIKMEEEQGESSQKDLNEEFARENIEPVLDLAIEQMRKDVDSTCTALNISPDPSKWSSTNVLSWIQWTSRQFGLPEPLPEHWDISGSILVTLTEEDFTKKASQGGMILHAQLEIWKAAYSEDEMKMQWLPETASSNASSGDVSDEEDEETASPVDTAKPTTSRPGGSHIHLWQFLKELLSSPQTHGSCIRWLDRSKGIFKIEDSVRVARLWGKRKNRPAMNYDKLSRSIRQYYKKGIMKKTERSQRLVYQFCHPYNL